MRILWLPHQDWEFIRDGQREFHLGSVLRQAHDVEFLSWRRIDALPRDAIASLVARTRRSAGFVVHEAPRVPNPLGARLHERSGRGLRINERLHQRALHRILAARAADVVICGIGHPMIGLPPADLPVPLVFDYLDFSLEAWPQLEAAYLARAAAVTCTSKVLIDRARAMHPHTYYLPNGVDVDRAARGDRERIRRELGLGSARVVSLIGVTAAARTFYVDALAEVARAVPDVVFLVVGELGSLGDAILRHAERRGVRVVATNQVPAGEVADYFAASDVGLYPGEKNAYFDAASPLKVLEYTAAHKPVVATDLAELRNWGFPNVHLAAPTSAAFAAEITAALGRDHEFPNLDGFRWAALGRRLGEILDEVVERGRR